MRLPPHSEERRGGETVDEQLEQPLEIISSGTDLTQNNMMVISGNYNRVTFGFAYQQKDWEGKFT